MRCMHAILQALLLSFFGPAYTPFEKDYHGANGLTYLKSREIFCYSNNKRYSLQPTCSDDFNSYIGDQDHAFDICSAINEEHTFCSL